MLYYVRRFPDAGTEAQQGEALARLVAHAGSLTLHAVRVGPIAGLYIDVPEAVASLVELRVLPALVGMEGCLERRKMWVRRPEWVVHALLTPTSEAQDLDISLLEGCVSSCITLHWTRSGVAGHLWASADDVPLLDAIEQRVWNARMVANGVAGRLVVLAHRPRKTTLQPVLALRPPTTHAPTTTVVVPMISEARSQTQETPAASLRGEPSLPAFVAAPGAPGLVLGMDHTALPLALAFRPQRLAVDASDAALGELVTILLERAFALGAGVVAIVPRGVAQELRHSPWRERLRWLDGDNPYQSASIPWRSLSSDALDAALVAGNVLPSGSGALASSFAQLLEQTGAAPYATDTVRSLTAPPGDDLRGVVAAGGGVVLVDGDASAPLLAALLLHLLAMLPPLQRPIVLFRPDHISVPDTLVSQVIDLVLGTATPAHSTLAQTPDGWTLSSADGSWQRTLLADLRNLAAAPDASAHHTLMAGLEGGDELIAPVQVDANAELPGTEELRDTRAACEEPIALAPGAVAALPTPVAAHEVANAFSWGGFTGGVDGSLTDAPMTTFVRSGRVWHVSDIHASSDDAVASTDDQAVPDEQPGDEVPVLVAHADESNEAAMGEPAADEVLDSLGDTSLPDGLHSEDLLADEALDLPAREAVAHARLDDTLHGVAADEHLPDALYDEELLSDSALDLLARETATDAPHGDSWSVTPLHEAPDERRTCTCEEESEVAIAQAPALASLADWNVSLGEHTIAVTRRAASWQRHPRLRRWAQRIGRTQHALVAHAEMPAATAEPDEPSHRQEARDGVLESVDTMGLVAPSQVAAPDLLGVHNGVHLSEESDDLSIDARDDGARDTTPDAPALHSSAADPVSAPPEPRTTEVARVPPIAPVPPRPSRVPTSNGVVNLAPVAEQLRAGIAEGLSFPALIARIAPFYPHVAPAVLRAAIRQFVAAPGAHLALAPLSAYLVPVAAPLSMSTHVSMSTEETGAPLDKPTEAVSTEETFTPVDMSTEETFTRNETFVPVDMSTEKTGAPLDKPTEAVSTEETFTRNEAFVPVDMSIEETGAPLERHAPLDKPTEAVSTEETPTHMDHDKLLLSTAEAAAELGVTPKTIQRWEEDGKITTLRYGRIRLVPRSEVMRLRATSPSH